jgi:pimeloyl-ACP methyl ester carboxylesterase
MTIRIALLALALALLPAAAAHAAPPSLPVDFEVENANRSALPCPADGSKRTVRGRLVLPAGPRPSTVTLYLHEYSFGRFFWDFAAVPGYDYAAALAERGHASVIVDRLGYDESDRPVGTATCLGAHADVARQIVARLKRQGFERVVLAGHSVGAAAAELAAHSFADLGIAGLMVFAWSDRDASQRTVEQSAAQGAVCAGGGEPADEGGPGGYAYYGQAPEDFQANVFASAEPAVVAAATRMRNRDPCGDAASLTQATVVNAGRAERIEVPVLVLFGERDPNFEPGAGPRQAELFSGSPDVTLRTFAGASHALTLEREAPAVQDEAARWLAARWPRGDAPHAPEPPTRARSCRSRRTIRITLPRGRRARRIAIAVPGRARRVIRGPRRTIRVDLRGLPRGRYAVRVSVSYRGGGTVRIIRRYRTCAPR